MFALSKAVPTSIRGCFQFSTASALSREWKTIEARKTASVELPKVGEYIPKNLHIPSEKPEFPEYKYDESRIFKQSNKGLYGGSFIQFGNQISEKSKIKTRRSWTPNVIKKKLWSEALQRTINIKVTARVLRTITKEGGIDNYLSKDKPARIKELGPTGWKLRFRVLMKKADQENPKTNYVELIEKENGEKIPVYAKVDDKKIIVGKRRLLSALYGLHLENNTDLTFKEFMFQYRDEPVEKIVQYLTDLHFDFASVTV